MTELAVNTQTTTRPHWTPDLAEPAPVDHLQELADDILLRCRGEGPANCVGRCPLRVDARRYVQLAKEGKFQDALQVVREQLPFPGVLGYVCAHPCELHCKRIDEDSPIRVRDIKRFLAEREEGPPQHIVDREPDRPQKIAVVGAGPGGLTAAHDLRRKGYQVTVYEREEQIGGCLTYKIPEYRLPRRVVERDLSVIEALGIDVRTGVTFGDDVDLDQLRREYDAVLLLVGYDGGMELMRAGDWPLEPSNRDTVGVDPLTCETGVEGVFAAGDAVSGPATVVIAMSLGRRAAESAHRFLDGQDLRADREPPTPRRLLWTLEIDELERRRRERTPMMLQPATEPMSEEEVLAEGERCLDCQCGLCVDDCEFLAKHCEMSPKELARKVKSGLLEDEVLKVVYSCNVCELCKTVCPEDLDTGALMLEARRRAVEKGKGPLPNHKPIVKYWNAGVSNLFSMTMPEPGRQRAKRLFFTGCALPAVGPKNTLKVYDELRKHYPGIGVCMYCCGAPVEVIGMEEEFEQTHKGILQRAEQVGAEELVCVCPDCVHTLKSHVPELKITTIWELLGGVWDVPKTREGVTVTLHDSCKARHEDGIQEGVRKMLEGCGAEVQEVDYREGLTRCCGFGGMIEPVDSELRQRISQRRMGETDNPLVTYCAGCRIALNTAGANAVHTLDFLLADDWKQAAAKKAPGAIPRYVNRLKTKWAFKRLRPLESE